MRISKRQLKRIIREEYSRLKRRGLLREAHDHSSNPLFPGGHEQAKHHSRIKKTRNPGYTVDRTLDFIEIKVDGSAPVRKGLCLYMDAPGGAIKSKDCSEAEFMSMIKDPTYLKPFFAVHFRPRARGSVYAGRGDPEGMGFNLIYDGEFDALIRG